MRRSAFLLVALMTNSLLSVSVQSAVGEEVTGQTTEFRRFGKLLSEQNPPMASTELQRYVIAIKRSDGARNCASKAPDGQINQHEGIDWSKIKTPIDLEICLYFSAAAFRDANLAAEFLAASGFTNVNILALQPTWAKPFGIDGDGIQLTSGILIDQVPQSFGGTLSKFFAYSLSFGLYLDGAGNPQHVQVNFNYE